MYQAYSILETEIADGGGDATPSADSEQSSIAAAATGGSVTRMIVRRIKKAEMWSFTGVDRLQQTWFNCNIILPQVIVFGLS